MAEVNVDDLRGLAYLVRREQSRVEQGLAGLNKAGEGDAAEMWRRTHRHAQRLMSATQELVAAIARATDTSVEHR